MSRDNTEGLPQHRPNIARRFGGYFLGRLLPPRETEKTPVEIAVDRENEMIDQRQQAHLHANLFRTIEPFTPENMQRITMMKDRFELELAQRHTIADRFSLFADAFYAPYINTLDLGETKQPGSHDEVLALKEEYFELLGRLVEAGLTEGELSRANAKRAIHFHKSPVEDFMTGTRNRELLSFSDDRRVITIAKRMTFLMPTGAYETHAHAQHQGRVRSLHRVEKLIDRQDDTIIPVRTVYYAKSKPIDTPES